MTTVLLGCGDGPGAPSAGSLAIAVSGLPDGVVAAITIDGPGGFTRAVTGSQTLTPLPPGDYMVAAAQVHAGTADYVPVPDAQTITLSGGDPATAAVVYAPAIGVLTITVTGLPSGASPDFEVTGPGLHRSLTAGESLTKLIPGSYTIAASSVTVGGTLYNPSPATQVVTVPAVESPVTATVAYKNSSTGNFNLSIDGMYVVQSTQTYLGTVPLVQNRDGLLRIFVIANQVNGARPAVRVRLYRDGTVISTTTIVASRASVPQSVDEGDIDASWNLVIPGNQLRPGLGIVADVDPGHTVAEGNESDNVFPATGSPLQPSVRPVSTLRIRFVPIRQSVNGHVGSVTAANQSQFLTATLRMHPLVGVESDVRAAYTTSAPALDPADADTWSQVLSELNAVRVGDPDAGTRNYFGVVSTAYATGIAGLGYVGGRAALGWDYLPSGAAVAAHELGHNWGRYHAPCGNVTRPDQHYPYPGGQIGVYGYDFATGVVLPPTYTDLMGYCGSQWISDYTYTGVMDYREADAHSSGTAANVSAAVASTEGPAEPGVLVWGRIVDGEPVLEPVFPVVGRPSMPAAPGPYTVEGLAADGSTVFALSFAPQAVADTRREEAQFAFVVPLSAARVGQLAQLRMLGPRRAVTVAPRPGPQFRIGAVPGGATVRRIGRGRVMIHWDAAAHPVVMVRDALSGQILSFARGGDADVVTDRDDLELVASDRVRSQPVRVKVSP